MIINNETETMEDLQCDGLRLIQSKSGFRFGEDSVMLVHYVKNYFQKTINAKRRIYDLGSNTGILSILLSAKMPGSSITGVEISSDAANMFRRNIEINNLSDKLSCLNYDWNEYKTFAEINSADVVISNPPYALTSGTASRKDATIHEDATRREILSNSDGLFKATRYLLRDKGMAFFIYRANRLTDILCGLRANGLEPIRVRCVCPYIGKDAKSVLVAARCGGKPGGLVVEKPLIIFNKQGKYSNEVIDMYGLNGNDKSYDET